MRRFGDVLTEAAAFRRMRVLEDEQDRQAVEDILDAAQEWQDGRLPLLRFAAIGAMRSPFTGNLLPQVGRAMTVYVTPYDDPRRAALLAAVQALIDYSEPVYDRRGCVYTRQELDRQRAWESTGQRAA